MNSVSIKPPAVEVARPERHCFAISTSPGMLLPYLGAFTRFDAIEEKLLSLVSWSSAASVCLFAEKTEMSTVSANSVEDVIKKLKPAGLVNDVASVINRFWQSYRVGSAASRDYLFIITATFSRSDITRIVRSIQDSSEGRHTHIAVFYVGAPNPGMAKWLARCQELGIGVADFESVTSLRDACEIAEGLGFQENPINARILYAS